MNLMIAAPFYITSGERVFYVIKCITHIFV